MVCHNEMNQWSDFHCWILLNLITVALLTQKPRVFIGNFLIKHSIQTFNSTQTILCTVIMITGHTYVCKCKEKILLLLRISFQPALHSSEWAGRAHRRQLHVGGGWSVIRDDANTVLLGPLGIAQSLRLLPSGGHRSKASFSVHGLQDGGGHAPCHRGTRGR